MATFGYTTCGGSTTPIENRICGSVFTCPEDGTADSITVWLTITDAAHNVKCAIYLHSDSSLVGSTEEKNVVMGDDQEITFDFSDPKPSLSANTEYVLVVWAEATTGYAYIKKDSGDTGQEHQQLLGYNSWPDPASFSEYNWKDSIYCTYTPAGGQLYEISVDAVVKASAPLATQTTYNIEKDALISSSGLVAGESVYNILKEAIIKGDATVEIEAIIEKIIEAVASVSVSATPELQSIFNILKNAEIKVSTAYTLESLFNLYPDAVIYATAIPEVSIGVVEKTKIFLMIGDIAIQLSGD